MKQAVVGTAWPRDRWLVIAATLVAMLLRTWQLDLMSIWQDEGLSLYRATQDMAGLISGAIPLGELATTDVHPPAYFALLAGWLKLVGVSTWTAKWLSMAASLPAVPLAWALGRRWVGRRTGLIAALLVALSPLYLWYAQEIRSYTLVVTLGLLAVYALSRVLEPDGGRRAVWAVGAVVANALLMWTHYLGFLLVAFQVLVVLAYALRGRSWRALVPLAVVGLLALPLLPFAVHRLGLGAERHQRFVPLDVMLLDVVRGFGLGRTFAAEWLAPANVLGPALIALFAALLALGVWHAWRRRPAAAGFLAGYLLVPVIGLYLITLVKPVYLGPYHLIAASPAFYLLVALGIAALYRALPAAGWVAGALVLAPMLLADVRFYHDPDVRKDDLRALAAYVDARAVPGDVLAVSDPVLERSFEQLARRLPVRTEPPMLYTAAQDDRPPGERLAPLLDEHTRLWFMAPHDDDREWLERNAVLVDEEHFHGADIPVYVQAYERPREPAFRLDPDVGIGPVEGVRGADLGGLRLTAWEVSPGLLAAGEAGRVLLEWEVGREVPDYNIALRLLDAEGVSWADGDHAPFHGERPTSMWVPGETVYEPHDLLVSPAAPPGTYQLGVLVYDGDGTYPPDGPLTIGEVRVERPDEPVSAVDVPVGQRVRVTGGGVTLLGYDLPPLADGRWTAANPLPIAVWARVDDPAAISTALRVEMIDGSGSVVASTALALASATGADGNLESGDVRRLSAALPVPPEADGGYGLRVRVNDGDGGVTWMRRGLLPVRGVWLGAVTVVPPERSTVVPEMETRLDVGVGDQITLLGFDGPDGEVGPGSALPVQLYWRAQSPVPAGYHVSVQLVPADADGGGPSGPPVAQHDGVPGEGARPTTGWLPGEVIGDLHRVELAPDLQPGHYWLIVALYDPAAPDQPRPIVRQADEARDFVLLQRIDVRGTAETEAVE